MSSQLTTSRADRASPEVRSPGGGIRVLVMCADIGGHVTVARSLADSLAERDDVAAVDFRTDLDVMGRRLGAFLTNGFRVHIDDVGWSYELAYRVFFELAGPRRAAHLALAALGGRGLRRTIAESCADVVVVEYPVLSATLGQLRALGRLAVPVCSSISDPAGLYYWAHPGIDLHLLSWPEALDEVERIAGSGKAAAVRPLVDPRFGHTPPPRHARAALELLPERPVVMVSGGGWGLGDLAGAAEAALRAVPEGQVLCLAGRSERTLARLKALYGRDRRLHRAHAGASRRVRCPYPHHRRDDRARGQSCRLPGDQLRDGSGARSRSRPRHGRTGAGRVGSEPRGFARRAH